MKIRMLLMLLAATSLTGCVVSFAPPAAMAPTAAALAIDAQRHEGLLAHGVGNMSPTSAAVEPVVVAAVR
ncbi:MAG: hypothetical protein R3E65_10515 [Steroidobacteraceae bacterium]